MHRPTVIRVFEHERLKIGDHGFGKTHWEILARWAERQTEGYVEVWRDSIRFLQWVGVIEVEGLQIEILPKAERRDGEVDLALVQSRWRRILLALLAEAGYLDVRGIDDASLDLQDRTLLDIVFSKFLDAVEVLIRDGLIKRYRHIAKDRGSVKGRIDHASNMRRNLVHAERISTVAIEYDRINPLNLILKAGVEASTRYAPSAFSRNRARSVGLYFSDWPQRTVYHDNLKAIQYDRKSNRYRRAVALARLILAKQNPDLSPGSKRVFSLLFDMNELWEKAIFARLKREGSRAEGCTVHGQKGRVFWTSNDGTKKIIRPDIVVERQGKGNTIVDTKWKVLTRSSPGDQDLRQIFAYDVRWDAADGFLLYPKIEGMENREGVFTGVVNGIERRCGVLLVWPDPSLWNKEPILPLLDAARI